MIMTTDAQAGPTTSVRYAAAAMAQAIRRLHERLGGAATVTGPIALAARDLWLAMDSGDVCIDLAQLPESAREAVLNSPVVLLADEAGTPGNAAAPVPGHDVARPLVLARERLYSWRYWQAEKQLAASLLACASAPVDDPRADTGPADAFDPFAGDTPGEAQRRAVDLAGQGRLLILTGGPGTGKTFTLAAIVRCAANRVERSRGAQESAAAVSATGAGRMVFTIAVAAPTGKATARLAGAIGQALAERTPTAQAPSVLLKSMTMHRLLGLSPGRGLDARKDPLPFDLIVIDECSMVDALMAHSLMTRLGPHASVVLAGDRDQLASVQAGAFFSAVCMTDLPALKARRVVLDQNYRQKEAPEIVAWADAVRRGSLTEQSLPDCGHQLIFESGGVGALVDRAVTRLHALVLKAALVGQSGLLPLYEAFLETQILSLLRAGPFGVDAINRAVSARLGGTSGTPTARWYPGRLVVVRRNALTRGLFNGDIGLCVTLSGEAGAPGTPGVVFPDPTERRGVRVILPGQMPEHEDAWALTVHQAQGSDFDEVLLMPAPPGHQLSSREGLYTALTRARRRIRIYGEPAELVEAAAAPMQRQSGLLDTLNGMTAI